MGNFGSSEGLVDKVTFKVDACGGCRSCEMACAFHHMKVFQRHLSSLDVTTIPRTLEHTLTFYRESVDGHIACDMCKGLETPLCVVFCPEGFSGELERLLKAHLSAPRDGSEKY